MSWSISIGNATKEELKRSFLVRLGQQVFGNYGAPPGPHSRDFQAIVAAANAVIDVQADDAEGYSISGYGHLAGAWEGGDLVRITGAEFTLKASATGQRASPRQLVTSAFDAAQAAGIDSTPVEGDPGAVAQGDPAEPAPTTDDAPAAG